MSSYTANKPHILTELRFKRNGKREKEKQAKKKIDSFENALVKLNLK